MHDDAVLTADSIIFQKTDEYQNGQAKDLLKIAVGQEWVETIPLPLESSHSVKASVDGGERRTFTFAIVQSGGDLTLKTFLITPNTVLHQRHDKK